MLEERRRLQYRLPSGVLTSNHFNKLVTPVHGQRWRVFSARISIFTRHCKASEEEGTPRSGRNRWERSRGTKNAFAVEFQRSGGKKGGWMMYR